MSYSKVRHKLQKLYANEIKNIIVKCKGSYILYDIYMVTNINGLWEVQRYGQHINMFDTSATAISWCLADRYGQIIIAHNLIAHDHRLQTKKNDVIIRREFLHSLTDPVRKGIALTRITNDLYICKCLKLEIEINCSSTKYIQIKGYIKQ